MNKAAFYAALRRRDSGVFGTSISQSQVEGLEAILDEGGRRGTSLFHLSAILAEAYHETGGQMQPVKETVYASSKDRNPSDETVIKRLDVAFKAGKLPWVSKPYWRDGWFGRGLIQITHKDNYDKLGVTKQSALDLKASVRVIFDGMEQGLFTGKKLADYDFLVTKTPPVAGYRYYASRAIVNGDMAVNGKLIEEHGKAFESALIAAAWGVEAASIPPVSVPSVIPMPSPDPIIPAKIEPQPVEDENWFSKFPAFLTSLFSKGAK